ncbi:MAG: Ig-like domain-containing protein, partial [Pirellulales bacterium]
GDYVSVFTVDIGTPSISIDLQPGSDMGVSASDDLTNVSSPTFDVVVNRSGTINFFLNGDPFPIDSLSAASAGTFPWTPSPLGEGANEVRARFVPDLGNPVEDLLTITVDTLPPYMLSGPIEEQAPVYSRTIQFSEPMEHLTAAGVVLTLTGPGSTNVPLTAINGSGDTFTLQFDPVVVPGQYVLAGNTAIADVAGNLIDQDMDGVGGELGQDQPVDAFTVLADVTPPQLVSFSPQGLVKRTVDSLSVTFNEETLPGTFVADDVVIDTPLGPIDSSSTTISPINLGAAAPGQWASSVVEFSTQYSSGSWSATQVLGVPNTFAYGDISTSWTASSQNATTEFITVAYDTPVFATGVTIRETYGNGFVRRIEVRDPSGNFQNVWEGVDTSQPGQVVDFPIAFTETEFPVDAVRITIDTDQDLGAWEEIDAISLHGYATPVDSFEISFPMQSVDGDYAVQIGPDISDLSSLPMAAPFVAAFSIELPLPIPGTPRDGVFIELFNGFGGGAAPTPGDLVGITPDGTTLSPMIDFPSPGSVVNVGNSFSAFFASTTTPPDAVAQLAASNFILRHSFFVAVAGDMDLDPLTPEIDVRFGVGSDDGFYLTIDDAFIGSAGDRGFSYSWFDVPFESAGLYPVSLLFAANASGQSGLEFAWETATSGGTQIVPQDALYVTPILGDQKITFEELPAGTVVSDQYRPDGVVFDVLGGDLQIVDSPEFIPVSAPNVFADAVDTPAAVGEVDFRFVVPGTDDAGATNFFSLFLIDTEQIGATVTAFDPEGTVIHFEAVQSGGGSQAQVQIQRDQIARVNVTLGQGADTAAIDNMSFNTPVLL